MNIVLVDENLLLLSALRKLLLLMSGISEVDIYVDGKVFLDEKSNNPPDILVIDLDSHTVSETGLLPASRALLPASVKIIVFSSATDVQNMKHTIKLGANGIISKTVSYEEFQEAILQVSEGKQYIGQALRDNLIHSVFTDDQIALHLSPREKEVLVKVCSGQTIKEIAYDLKLSAHTVQYYHRSVMDKCKVKRTTDLIVYAIKHRLYIPENL
ncbi:response regulator transcription factor [Dyadobacter sp. CY323]|uniref:response regulator transcription factor n=1 Tax=Dyadobacter sp. CY323 TaxID=2907302 RepID=UPI001F455928|nr:response regulator transcription factor [Dyadobacter sp. CY323]MCE6992883.1 response regulator transcription factor [Dyadobacter sp. CY323]